jgi:site-specific DNA-methyltransferase (adenine-specific)
MKELDNDSIDLTVTSPPYDNLRTYNGNNALWGEHVWKAVIQDLYRVTKDGGVVVWVVGDATIKGSETGTSFKQALWAKECGFNLHDTMIYQKKGGLNSGSLKAYQQKFEYMFVWSKGVPTTINLIKDRPNKHTKPRKKLKRQKDGGYAEQIVYTAEYGTRYNIWIYQTGKHHSTSYEPALKHPAIFPEKLAHDHIISWSNEGDTVLDCFGGSGTVAVACKRLKRNCIIIEIDPTYCEIIRRRLDEKLVKELKDKCNTWEVKTE